MNAYATRARRHPARRAGVAAAAALAVAAEPAGEVNRLVPRPLAPACFDPSTARPSPDTIGVMYAIHDALVRPLPTRRWAPAWRSRGRRARRARVRVQAAPRAQVHNGDPLSAEDVKFSFDRYNGRRRARAARGASGNSRSSIRSPCAFTLKEPWAGTS